VQCGSKKRQGLGWRVVEILGGGTGFARGSHGAYREHALTQVPPDGDRQTTTRVILAQASSEVLCWLLEGGMGGGGYSPSGKGRDDKLFIPFPLSPDGVLKMMMSCSDLIFRCSEGGLTISGLHTKPWRC
jgi:hypothetical protein